MSLVFPKRLRSFVKFKPLDTDSFGSYTIKNVIGESKPIHLVQTVDGGWSEWSSWSPCSKTCLSKVDLLGKVVNILSEAYLVSTINTNINKINTPDPGHHTRWRTCDNPKPENRGRDCLGVAQEMDVCSPKL